MWSKGLFAALLAIGWVASDASAQTSNYPDKPIRVVIPFPPGGPTDGMARIVVERLSDLLGQATVIDNRGGGAGGSVGARFVADAAPDGYTILLTPGGSIATGPAIHQEKLGYDPDKVFTPVTQLIETPMVMSVHPSLPVKTMADLVKYMKANPGKVSWGLQGFGTGAHLMAELFKLETGTDAALVPYRGTGPMLNAILAGEVHVVIDPATTSLAHIEAGKLRPIAIAGSGRFDKMPEVETTAEQGYPKMVRPFWLGVVAPMGTPKPIIDKLNSAFREALAFPETRKRLAFLGAEVKVGTPEAFWKMVTEERSVYSGVVKAAGIKVQ